ncbi:hypothetical protein FJZ18_04725 [Candidatus Pacearchaeota archaeon]|nr:hypothetical protein [Candidatus Pacearchaeota archaeon]
MDFLPILLGTGTLLFTILVILAGILVFQGDPTEKQRPVIQKDIQKIKDQIVSPDRKRKQRGFYSSRVKDI